MINGGRWDEMFRLKFKRGTDLYLEFIEPNEGGGWILCASDFKYSECWDTYSGAVEFKKEWDDLDELEVVGDINEC